MVAFDSDTFYQFLMNKTKSKFKTMINRENDRINPSVSGGSDLNQELVENSDYTKSTSESGMMSNDGTESSGMNKGENTDEHHEQEDNKDSNEGNYKVSQMNKKMEDQKDKKKEGNYQISALEIGPTDSDVPFDVPNDQTPPMTDLPKNYEQYSKKGDNSEPADE